MEAARYALLWGFIAVMAAAFFLKGPRVPPPWDWRTFIVGGGIIGLMALAFLINLLD